MEEVGTVVCGELWPSLLCVSVILCAQRGFGDQPKDRNKKSTEGRKGRMNKKASHRNPDAALFELGDGSET